MNDFLSPSAREVGTSRPEILVVDDDPGILTVLDEWLRNEGVSVWLAATGSEALEVYGRHHETIDVVLMDVCMPGLDGPGTLPALRAINPNVCCCFMSGQLGEYTEADLANGGAACFIRKPFRLDELTQTLLSLVRPRVSQSRTV